MTTSPQARWLAKKRLDPEYRKKIREYYREYRKRRKEQEGMYPAQTYYNLRKNDPEFKAKRKKYRDKQRLNPKWKEYRKQYAREVYAARLKERRQNDPEWAEKQRQAGRVARAKRKADPVLHAAFLERNREICRKYYREVTGPRNKERRQNDSAWREKIRQ